ncbi:S41 family peptidase [Clostridium aestuarii]|uniref:S41 family peptidase n=1 Tax=Clostridium aestuarii TaxID=338193 RepID=A0ABT4CWD2_9CLOT|nr:S41 family peptidase [Clostridium aestuarii]MCY6483306.1 S41 family peptidase [Clostridium aestuarii]
MDYKEINGCENKKNPNEKKSNLKRIGIGILIVVLTNFITFTIALRMPLKGTVRISESKYDEISKFSKMFIVKQNIEMFYDGKIDENKLIDGAIKGIANSVNDPYTVYMDKDEYKEFSTYTEGDYVGLGIRVGVKDNKIVIIAPFEDSPAKKAGIISGDIIEKVDGKQVLGKDLDKAISMMKGEKNTYVVLTINRQNTEKIDIKVKRDVIPLITVSGEMLDDKIGYIQISTFAENTGSQFQEEVNRLNKKGMTGLILDLRQNPGGWLTQSIEITSKFVEKGKTIVSTIDKNKNKEEFKSKGGELIGIPLVVLIDGGTASASEIFSGAIRDYELGTLVGEKTFGKGIVQSVLDKKRFGFGDGTALKVTTSKYYTPNGENIHHKGIKPNIEVKYPKDLLKKTYSRETDPQFKKALEIMKEKMK